jgi:hypothetical protein
MTGEIIQAVAEIVLNVPLRRNRRWRRLVWIVMLAVLAIAIVSTLGK